MGVFEFDKFAAGTFAVANALAALKGGLAVFDRGLFFSMGAGGKVHRQKAFARRHNCGMEPDNHVLHRQALEGSDCSTLLNLRKSDHHHWRRRLGGGR